MIRPQAVRRPQCAVKWDRNLKPKLAIMRQCTSVTDRRTDRRTGITAKARDVYITCRAKTRWRCVYTLSVASAFYKGRGTAAGVAVRSERGTRRKVFRSATSRGRGWSRRRRRVARPSTICAVKLPSPWPSTICVSSLSRRSRTSSTRTQRAERARRSACCAVLDDHVTKKGRRTKHEACVSTVCTTFSDFDDLPRRRRWKRTRLIELMFCVPLDIEYRGSFPRRSCQPLPVSWLVVRKRNRTGVMLRTCPPMSRWASRRWWR